MKDPEQELADLLARREEIRKQAAEKTKRLKTMERKRRDAINRRIRRAKYRVSAEERKRRTRRLILLGAWTERRMKDNPETQRRVLEGLDADLERNRDRALFDLPPQEQQA